MSHARIKARNEHPNNTI